MVALSCSADKGVNIRSFCLFLRIAILSLAFLTLGACSSTNRNSRNTFNHTIAKGDTLFSLGQRYGVSIGEIRSFNDVDDPKSLQVGNVLVIPRSKYRDYELVPPGAEPADAGRAGMSFTKLEIQSRLKIPLAWPVTTIKIISPFGDRGDSFHEGVDLHGEEGDPVFAAHDGVVAYSGEGLSGYGNLLVLRGEGFFTVYAHNSKLLVDKGEKVMRGQKVAEVGQTGRATAPHVHFELRMRNGEGRYQAVNPLPFLTQKHG